MRKKKTSSERAIDVFRKVPHRFGNEVGFTKLEPIHGKWIYDMVFGKGDKTLQSHRGSYKTTCDSVSFAIILMLFPDDTTMFMRKTDNDVKEIIKQTEKILSSAVSRQLSAEIWGTPVIMTKATATEISTNLSGSPKGTSQLTGMGVYGSLTGKHFDRIFTDDIVNIEDRISKAEREHTKLVYQELQNVRNRGGRIYNTGTPWHKDDCFSLMPTPDKYDYKRTGLISDDEIEKIRESMLPSLFAANYELRHIASEKVIFKNPATGADPVKVEQSNYCHIDAAYGGEDFTAFTICRKAEGKYWIFGKLWQKHVDDCLDEIIHFRKKFNAGRIYCEKNADKGYLGKELKALGERVTTYTESENKFQKIVTYLRREWKDIVFVEGTDKEYIEQITDYNEDADHDDAPDSLASTIRKLWQKEESENEEDYANPYLW